MSRIWILWWWNFFISVTDTWPKTTIYVFLVTRHYLEYDRNPMVFFLAIVVSGCPLSCMVRRAWCVVRRASTFDVYTIETTFVIRFLWNLVRMLVLTISRPSSNMGHVRSKTRSSDQILGNSCFHSRGHICDPRFWWTLVRMFVLTIFRPSLNMGHVGSKLGHQVKS